MTEHAPGDGPPPAAPSEPPSSDLAVLLDSVSRSLAEATTGYRDVIDLVVRTSGTVLAGSAVMWLTREGTGPEVASVWAPDAEQRDALMAALRARQLPTRGFPAADVIRTGEPIVLDDVAREDLLAGIPPEPLRHVRAPKRVAVAAVPLRARGRTLGTLSIYRPAATDAFLDADVLLLQQLADRAALAIDNAALLDAAERELAERRRVEGALLAATSDARRLAALVESASDVIAVLTPDGFIHYVNAAVEQVLGRRWGAGQSIDVFRIMHPDDRDRVRDIVRAAIHQPGPTVATKFRILHADGSWRTVESVGNNLLDDPAIHGFVVTMRDVTDRTAAEERAAVQASRQADIAALGNLALARLDMAPLVDDALSILSAQLGADCVHMLDVVPGADFLVLRASRGHAGAAEGVVLVSSDPAASPGSLAVVTGEVVTSGDLAAETRFDVPALWADSCCASVLEVPIPGQDDPVGVIGVGHRMPRSYEDDDVHFAQSVANVLAAATARHRAEETIREQARRDQLTGLPNRLALVEHLDALLADAVARPLAGALLVLDIDRFKEINDTLGHQVGDRVLLEAADRFRRLGDQIDMVARLGGDEFAVYSSVLQSAEDAQALARRLLDVLGEATDIAGVRLRLRGSVGVVEGAAVDQDLPTSAVSLLRRAEAAMYRAKRHASGYSRWTSDLDRSGVSKLSLAGELGEALAGREFTLVYQPKVACRTDRPLGVEALVRWRHPLRGTVLPDSFVPLAEQTGIIKPLTAWVLEEALAQRAAWAGRFDGLSMAVNLSASTLHDPELFEAVATALARSGAPPECVELEITESAVMHDPQRALAAVTELSKIGVRFAIDDFGTGYSSLAYLQRLPVALVKVDKSFVMPLLEQGTARSIVRAVIELAHSLGISVTAEGVESAEVASVLGDLGCDELQGYHIGRPMPPSGVAQWLDGRIGGTPAGLATGAAGLATADG